MAEVKQRVDSINWYTSLVSLVLTAFAAWNIEVDLNANDVVNEVIAKNWNYIVTILVPSVITISMKLYTKYKAKLLKLKDLIKSPNFITQALSVVALVTTLIGITFGSEIAINVKTIYIIISLFYTTFRFDGLQYGNDNLLQL